MKTRVNKSAILIFMIGFVPAYANAGRNLSLELGYSSNAAKTLAKTEDNVSGVFYNLSGSTKSEFEWGEDYLLVTKLKSNMKSYFNSYGKNLTLKIKAGLGSRIYSTNVFDQGGNRYKNNYIKYKLVTNGSYKLSSVFRVGLTVILNQKNYSSRMAELADGNVVDQSAGESSPMLKQFNHTYQLGVTTRLIGKAQLRTIFSYGIENDQINGARDAFRIRGKQSAYIPVSSSFFPAIALKPQISVAYRQYSQFKSDLTSPATSDLRSDTDIGVGLSSVISMGPSLNLEIGYSFFKENYEL